MTNSYWSLNFQWQLSRDFIPFTQHLLIKTGPFSWTILTVTQMFRFWRECFARAYLWTQYFACIVLCRQYKARSALYKRARTWRHIEHIIRPYNSTPIHGSQHRTSPDYCVRGDVKPNGRSVLSTLTRRSGHILFLWQILTQAHNINRNMKLGLPCSNERPVSTRTTVGCGWGLVCHGHLFPSDLNYVARSLIRLKRV